MSAGVDRHAVAESMYDGAADGKGLCTEFYIDGRNNHDRKNNMDHQHVGRGQIMSDGG